LFAIAFGVVGALTELNGFVGVAIGALATVFSSLMAAYWARKSRLANRRGLNPVHQPRVR
jgi:hypothetical protein